MFIFAREQFEDFSGDVILFDASTNDEARKQLVEHLREIQWEENPENMTEYVGDNLSKIYSTGQCQHAWLLIASFINSKTRRRKL